MKKRILLFSVFLCGASVMVLEIVGARILAPYVGTTITVWTSIIGVILGAMSLGYVFGGKLADKNPKFEVLSLLIGFSGLSMAVLCLIRNYVFKTLMNMPFSNEVTALVIVIILFAIPSFLLATVSPYAIKLSLTSFENSGKTAGNIYALSTLGSITGTFLAGFFLIPMFGSITILYAVSVVLIILSFTVFFPKKCKKSAAARILMLSVALFSTFHNSGNSALFPGVIAEVDTQYNNIKVIENGNVRVMITDKALSSARFLDSDELVLEYTKLYDLAMFFNPHVKRALILGGAGYSYPQHFINKYSDKALDVVEIDPKTTELARKYFHLKDNPRMRIFHQDARIFLNNNEIRYDVIFGDTFASFTPPFQLITKEANERIYESLSDDGVYMVNMIDALEGINSKLFSAYYHTLLQTFPRVLLFIPRREQSLTDIRNIAMVALKNPKIDMISEKVDIQNMLDKIYNGAPSETIILTDDYAPVEFFKRGIPK